MGSTITTPNLGLVKPDPTDPTCPFDWKVFLNDNFDRLDDMKVVGGLKIFNAKEYLDATTGRFRFDTIKTEIATLGYDVSGFVVYFPAGDYPLADATVYTTGITIGTTETPGSFAMIGDKGARIMAGSLGNTITDMVNIEGVDDVFITGLEFVGNANNSSTNTNTAIRITEGDRIYITGNNINNVLNGIMVQDASSTRVANKVWVTDNIISDFFGQAIRTEKATDVQIAGNDISISTSMIFPSSNTGANAIEFKPGVGSDLQSCSIRYNTIKNARRNAIQLTANADAGVAPHAVTVECNTIDSPGLFASPSTETTKSTRGSGVYSTVVGNVIVTGNVIRDPLSCGMYFQDALNLTVSGNILRMMDVKNTTTDASLHGIELQDCDYAMVQSNTIYNNYTTTVLSPTWAGGSIPREAIQVTSSDYVTIQNNLIRQWFMALATCNYAIVTGNRISSYTAAISAGTQLVSMTSVTLDTPLIPDKFVPPSQLGTVAPSGVTQSGSLGADGTNGGLFFTMIPYVSTASHSRVTITIEAPKKRSNANFVIKLPVRSAGAGVTANFDYTVGGYSLESTTTQNFLSVYTATVSVAAPSSTVGPTIASISIPHTAMPTNNSAMMLTLVRKDANATNIQLLGAKFRITDILGGNNAG